MTNHPFHHLQYETKVTGFSWAMQNQRNESNEWKIH